MCDFFDKIEIRINSISNDHDYLYRGDLVFYYDTNGSIFRIYDTYITSMLGVEYNRKVHDLIIQFVGKDYDYYISRGHNLYTIEQFERLCLNK